jgi:hypothetical protein
MVLISNVPAKSKTSSPAEWVQWAGTEQTHHTVTEPLIHLYYIWSPEWHSSLRHSISVLQTLVRFQAVSQPAVIGSPIEQCTIGPVSAGVGCHFK